MPQGEFQILLYEINGIIVRVKVNKEFLRKGGLEAAKRRIANKLKETTLLTKSRGKAKKVVDLRTL